MNDLLERVRHNRACMGIIGTIMLPAELHHELIAEIERLRAIVAKLPKTVDGVPITPDIELWQIDPSGFVNQGVAWQCGPGWTFQQSVRRPVYSTREVAEAAGDSDESSG